MLYNTFVENSSFFILHSSFNCHTFAFGTKTEKLNLL